MRHEISPNEARAIHEARRKNLTLCGWCGHYADLTKGSLSHYCEPQRDCDKAEVRAGTQ